MQPMRLLVATSSIAMLGMLCLAPVGIASVEGFGACAVAVARLRRGVTQQEETSCTVRRIAPHRGDGVLKMPG